MPSSKDVCLFLLVLFFISFPLVVSKGFIKSLNVEAEPPILYECKYCGEPSSTDLCKACEILKLLEDDGD